MNGKTSCVLALLFLIALAENCFAATYYLDANGVGEDGVFGTADDVVSSDANPGTSSQPWKTLNKAKSTAVSGDTVIVRNGSYGAYIEADFFGYPYPPSVTRTNWVTYQAATGHQPLLSQIAIDNYSTTRDTYLKFDGFKVKGQYIQRPVQVFARNTRHVQFLNLEVEGSAPDLMSCNDGDYPGIQISSSEDATINNCIIKSSDTSRRKGYTDGIIIGGSSNVTVENCDISGCLVGIEDGGDENHIIKNNNIHKLISDGFFGRANNLTIENNTIHDLSVYVPTLAETPTDTTWNGDGTVMTNPNAKWNTAGETLITTATLGFEIYVVSGTNVLEGDGEQYGNGYSFNVKNVSQDGTQITLTKGIAKGGQPSNVNYIIRSGVHTDLIQIAAYTETSNVTIRKNQCYDTDGQICFINPHLDSTSDHMGGHNFLIENNLFWNSATNGLEEYSSSLWLLSTDGLVFRNNIVIGSALIGRDKNVKILNNIIGYIEFWSNNLEPIEMNYNIYNRGGIDSPFSAGSHDTFLNPGYSWDKWNDPQFTGLFVDYNNGDFRHASATSLGVGHGDPTNSPTTDILGNPRDSTPDAGAYEFQGAVQPECIDNDKLLDYIFQWKQGNITMPTLMQKIALWKAGTGR